MEDVTRKRILRKLEALPDEQLYQVLDYIEFIEAKYAAAALRKPDALQQFAERLEDQMRVRALAPRAMRGTMKVVSTATRVLDGVRELGRDLVAPGGGPGAGKRARPVAEPGEGAGEVADRGADGAPRVIAGEGEARGNGGGRAGGPAAAAGGTGAGTEGGSEGEVEPVEPGGPREGA